MVSIYHCFTLLIIIFIGVLLVLYNNIQKQINVDHINDVSEKMPIILWWTPFTLFDNITRVCKFGSCLFTKNRSYFYSKMTSKNIKAILFYGSNFSIDDLPLPRFKNHWWCLLHEESPKNQPLFNHELALSLFNLTSTFRSASGIPLTLQYLRSSEALTSKQYFKETTYKNKLIKDKGLASFLYIQSDCDPPSFRDSYVLELSKYILIDSYGTCLNNKSLPEALHGIDAINDPEFLSLVSQYKFTIAFENAACEDYMTEKLWRPLKVGSVPIYWGNPAVQKWLPNPKSIIHVRDFINAKDLSQYLLRLLQNDSLYEEFLDHKLKQVVNNEKLLKDLTSRSWGVEEDQLIKDTFVDAFECYVCDSSIKFNGRANEGDFVATAEHYGCPEPETMRPKVSKNNFWMEQWHKAKAEAEVLVDMIRDGFPLSLDKFYEKVIDILLKRNHFERFITEEL